MIESSMDSALQVFEKEREMTKYDQLEGHERCGNIECSRFVHVTKQTLMYDGYVFCCSACRNTYAEGDGLIFTGSGTMFYVDRPDRQGQRV